MDILYQDVRRIGVDQLYRTNGVVHEKLVVAHEFHFRERYNDRGYTLEEVEPCILSRDGDLLTIDTTHESYPSVDRTEKYYKPVEMIQDGAGSELKNLLRMVGITSSPNCKCNLYAAHMNNMGTEWCSDNIDEIVSWLKEEATKRKLPFSKALAKQVVKLAIRRAIKKEQS
jgi:hypothetical protein